MAQNRFRGLSGRNTGSSRKKPRAAGYAPTETSAAAGAQSSSSSVNEGLRLEVKPTQLNFDFDGDSILEAAGRSFVKLYDPNLVARAVEYQYYNTYDSDFGFPILAYPSGTQIEIGADYDQSTQLKADMWLRLEGTTNNDTIYKITAVGAYDSVNKKHTITVDTALTQTATVDGRVSWVRTNVARTGAPYDSTYTDDDGKSIPFEDGAVGSDIEVWRIFTAKLYHNKVNQLNVRAEFSNELGDIDYVYANHTYDSDNRANISGADAWVDSSGELILRWIGDEDTRSMVYLYQTTPYTAHSSFSATIADFRANGTLIPDIVSTEPTGYRTGVFITGSNPVYVALLPYSEANPTLLTSEKYGLTPTYLLVDTISDNLEIQRIKSQFEATETGVLVRRGKLVLRITDGTSSVQSVEARYTDHTQGVKVSAGDVDRFVDWAAMTDGGQNTHTISGVNQGLKQFTFDQDVSSDFYAGQRLEVLTGANAGLYSISAVAAAVVTVEEDIPSATVEGDAGIKGQKDYSVTALLSEKQPTFIEWRVTSDRGLPTEGSEEYDFDAIPEIISPEASLLYYFDGLPSEEDFEFNLDYEWDEDVASVKILLHNSLTRLPLGGGGIPVGQDEKFSGVGLSAGTVLITEATPDGNIKYKAGDVTAGTLTITGTMPSIKRGDYLWWYAIAIDADGRVNAKTHHGRILVNSTPKVMPEYSQSNGYARARIWVQDYAPGGESWVESLRYRVGQPIAAADNWVAGPVLTAATNGPDGTTDWDGYYEIGGTGDAFLINRMRNTELEWVMRFKAYVNSSNAVFGSHTFDTDLNATLVGASIRRVLNGNGGEKVVLDYEGDEDTFGIMWEVEQKATEGATASLGIDPTADVVPATFLNGRRGNDVTLIQTYDPLQYVYVALTALSRKNVQEDPWAEGDTLADVRGIHEEPRIIGLAPSFVRPIVEVVESQTGTTGTLTLNVRDPQEVVQSAHYKVQTNPSTGYGAEQAWTNTGTATAKIYTFTQDPLPKKNHAFIQWRVVWKDTDGVDKDITGVSSFDYDTKAQWENPPQLTIDNSNQPVFTWDMDEDGAQVRYETSTVGPVTAFTGSAVVVAQNSGSATFTAINEGETFYILARAEKAGGGETGEKFADSVILPSYTAGPLALANARVVVSNNNLFIGYTGGSSVDGVYYTVGTNESFNIGAVDTVAETITVNALDLTDRFQPDDVVTIAGSTGNDGDYTITAISFTGGNTVFTFGGDDLTNATADGTVTMKTLRDPDENDTDIQQQVAFIDTGITIDDGVHVTVKIAAYDSAFPAVTGTVYPIVTTADSDTKPQIFWAAIDIDPGGLVYLIIGADDDTNNVYYEWSKSAMPAGPITTADLATSQGSGIYQIPTTEVTLDPGETIYIRLAGYNSTTSEFTTEWEFRETFNELPDFATKPRLIIRPTDDPGSESGWGPGRVEFSGKLNAAADRIKFRIAHSDAPVGTWEENVFTLGASVDLVHQDFLDYGGNYTSANGVPEGKAVVLQIQAASATRDGKIYQLSGVHGTANTIIPSYVLTPAFGGTLQNPTGTLTLDVFDPTNAIPLVGPEGSEVQNVQFSKRVGLGAAGGFALRDSGSGNQHAATIDIDKEHGSEILFKIPWKDKDSVERTLQDSHVFQAPYDPKITNLNLTVGEMIDDDQSADYRKFYVYLSWESNRDTDSVRYLAAAGASPDNTTSFTVGAPPDDVTYTGVVVNSRTGDAVQLGPFEFATDVYVAVEPFKGEDAPAGESGETAKAHIKTPADPGKPHFKDNTLVPLMLANPPYSGTVTATPVLLDDESGYEWNQLNITVSIDIPGHGAKSAGPADYVVSAGELVWNTNLNNDPAPVEIGLEFGGDSSQEGVFLLGYIDDITDDGSGNPPFYLTAHGKGVLTAPILYAGSFTALLGNIKTLNVEKAFTVLTGGEFRMAPLFDGVGTDVANRVRGTFIDDWGIRSYIDNPDVVGLQGLETISWNATTGELRAGADSIIVGKDGVKVVTGDGNIVMNSNGIVMPAGGTSGGVNAGGSIGWTGNANIDDAYLGYWEEADDIYTGGAGVHGVLGIDAEKAFHNGVFVSQGGLFSNNIKSRELASDLYLEALDPTKSVIAKNDLKIQGGSTTSVRVYDMAGYAHGPLDDGQPVIYVLLPRSFVVTAWYYSLGKPPSGGNMTLACSGGGSVTFVDGGGTTGAVSPSGTVSGAFTASVSGPANGAEDLAVSVEGYWVA